MLAVDKSLHSKLIQLKEGFFPFRDLCCSCLTAQQKKYRHTALLMRHSAAPGLLWPAALLEAQYQYVQASSRLNTGSCLPSCYCSFALPVHDSISFLLQGKQWNTSAIHLLQSAGWHKYSHLCSGYCTSLPSAPKCIWRWLFSCSKHVITCVKGHLSDRTSPTTLLVRTDPFLQLLHLLGMAVSGSMLGN